MTRLWFGILPLLGLLAALPVAAQTAEELQRQLAEKEAEVQLLRQRIEVLEREVTPRRVMQGPAGSMPDDVEDSNRALERALVREGGLLLSSGTFEVEPNLLYSSSNQSSVGFRRDAYGPGLTLRAGLPWRTQFDISVPYVFERRRLDGDSSSASGIGDVSLGLSHQFVTERRSLPSIIGTLQYDASTGRNTLFESANPVALGSGFNAVRASLTALKRVDPLVFFGTYGYTHTFSETRNGIDVDPGNAHSIRFGTGLATGPTTSVRTALSLTYPDKLRFGGTALAGTNDPLGALEFGASVVLTEAVALDVLVGTGITRATPDFRIGIALPIRF